MSRRVGDVCDPELFGCLGCGDKKNGKEYEVGGYYKHNEENF